MAVVADDGQVVCALVAKEAVWEGGGVSLSPLSPVVAIAAIVVRLLLQFQPPVLLLLLPLLLPLLKSVCGGGGGGGVGHRQMV